MKFILTLFIILQNGYLFGQSSVLAVLKIENLRFEAMVKKDTSYLKKILADSLVYVHSDGQVDTKKSLISSIAKMDLDYRQMDVKEIISRAYPGIVIISGRMEVKIYLKKRDTLLDLHIRFLDVYHKIKNKWQLVAWQSARLN